MFRKSSPPTSNNCSKLKIVWFKDGFGIDNGKNTYTVRASNIVLNLQRIAGFTTSAVAYATFLPKVLTDANDANHEYYLYGTYLQIMDTTQSLVVLGRSPWFQPIGRALVENLINGGCNAFSIPQNRSVNFSEQTCLAIYNATDDRLSFTMNSILPTTCENLLKISYCIADFAMRYSDQRVEIYPPSTNGDTSFNIPAIVATTAVSITALGALAFFGRKIYNEWVANSGYAPVPTSNTPSSGGA